MFLDSLRLQTGIKQSINSPVRHHDVEVEPKISQQLEDGRNQSPLNRSLLSLGLVYPGFTPGHPALHWRC